MQIIQDGRWEGNRPIRDWIDDISKLSAFDQTTDNKLKAADQWSAAGWIGLFTDLLFAPFFFNVELHFLSIGLGALLGLGLLLRTRTKLFGKILLIMSGSYGLLMAGRYVEFEFFAAGLLFPLVIVLLTAGMQKRLRHRDVRNEIREVAFPLLRVLAEDAAPKSSTKLLLHFREADAGFLRSSQEVPLPRKLKMGEAGVLKRHVSFYEEPWLDLETELQDGSRLRLQATDFRKVVQVKKRNPRGKTKSKTKSKVVRKIDLQLGLPNEKYRVDDDSPLLRKSSDKQVSLRWSEKVLVAPLQNAERDAAYRQTLDTFSKGILALYEQADARK